MKKEIVKKRVILMLAKQFQCTEDKAAKIYNKYTKFMGSSTASPMTQFRWIIAVYGTEGVER